MGHGGLEPASSLPQPLTQGRSQVTPGSLLQHLWCSSWNLPRLSWLSCSLSQISFSKAFHGVWITASGSHQLDVLFLFSLEPLLLPVSHPQGGCWERESVSHWCVTRSADLEGRCSNCGRERRLFSCETHPRRREGLETGRTDRLAALWSWRQEAEGGPVCSQASSPQR